MDTRLSKLAQAAERTSRLAASSNKGQALEVYSYSPNSKFAPKPKASSALLAKLKDIPYGIKG